MDVLRCISIPRLRHPHITTDRKSGCSPFSSSCGRRLRVQFFRLVSKKSKDSPAKSAGLSHAKGLSDTSLLDPWVNAILEPLFDASFAAVSRAPDALLQSGEWTGWFGLLEGSEDLPPSCLYTRNNSSWFGRKTTKF